MRSDGVAGRQSLSHADWDRPWTHSGAAQPSGSQSQHHCSAQQDHGQGSRDPHGLCQEKAGLGQMEACLAAALGAWRDGLVPVGRAA